ncbi:MAG: hypothetical protein ACC628_05380 [Pirellulaceae bacterium]
MLRCREISKLLSESMEHKLPLRIRLQMWMHLAMCRWCSGFARQVRLFRRAVREHPSRLIEDDTDATVSLSQQARARIKTVLRDNDS